MGYCEFNDIVNRIGSSKLIELTQTEDNPGLPDKTHIATAIADADLLIDLYLQVRYETPLVSAPDIIKNLSKDITIYYLYSDRYDDELPKNIIKRYDDAKLVLKDLRDGRMELTEITELTESDDTIQTNKDSTDRIYNDTFKTLFRGPYGL